MLGFVVTAGAAEDAEILPDVAQRLTGAGVRVVGAIQHNLCLDPARPCQMDLSILGTDALVRISQDRGPHASGCRLDPQGLAQAVALVETRFDHEGAQIVIVNKFGKSEAEGSGFRAVIGKAIAAGVPVLTIVAPGQLAAFEGFAGDLAVRLPADQDAVLSWCLTRIAGLAEV